VQQRYRLHPRLVLTLLVQQVERVARSFEVILDYVEEHLCPSLSLREVEPAAVDLEGIVATHKSRP